MAPFDVAVLRDATVASAAPVAAGVLVPVYAKSSFFSIRSAQFSCKPLRVAIAHLDMAPSPQLNVPDVHNPAYRPIFPRDAQGWKRQPSFQARWIFFLLWQRPDGTVVATAAREMPVQVHGRP
jgi:hypothetical protein